MSFDLSRIWYRPTLHWVSVLLLPFSWMFGVCALLRRALYRYRILPVLRASVPVIVVGNITVGGTGKTPFVIWLAQFLREHGFNPGIVSRGVGGRKHREPHAVSLSDSASLVGDEALLLAKNAKCPVVICTHRPRAVNLLLERNACDIIINDDGLQHYRLARDIEIAMVDGVRRFGNQKLLPAGPLRESISRLKKVNMVIVNGGNGADEFQIHFLPEQLIALNDNARQTSLETFSQQTVHAIAGIGHPERFFQSLEQAGMHVIPHVFPDHHRFKSADIHFADDFPIIMTEKDAVKCGDFADDKCWYLVISTHVSENLQQALQCSLRTLT
jgi:tetraacyldisaccharide 4'-kinase